MFGTKKPKMEKPMVVRRLELSKNEGLQTLPVKGMSHIYKAISLGDKLYLLVNTRLDEDDITNIQVWVTEDELPTGEGYWVDSVTIGSKIYHIKRTERWIPGGLP